LTKKNSYISSRNPTVIWNAVLGILELEIPRPNFKTWLKSTKAINISDNTLTVSTPSPFAAEMINKRLMGSIRKSIKKLTGEKFNIKITIEGSENLKDVQTSPKYVKNQKIQTKSNLLNNKQTFDTFIECESNILARSAALKVSDSPGETYNPLYIYSDVGLGKTHLLNAIGNKLKLKQHKVIYLSSEKFTNEYIAAIRNGKIDEFQSYFRNCDALLIDDIQFIGTKPQTQEGFFHIFNHLHMNKKQIVVTGDDPANKIALKSRIQSRLSGGIEVDIQEPKYESKFAILSHKAPDIGTEVIEYLAKYPHKNVRELEGALNRIKAFSQLTSSVIDITLVDESLSGLKQNKENFSVTKNKILEEVSKYKNVSVDNILGTKKDRLTVNARQLVMFFLKKELNMTFIEIALFLGGKNHSTVIYALERIEKILKKDQNLVKDTIHIRELIYRKNKVKT
tara:strand:- start:5057 stop:6415 length:1359 start_codon:yes stop_codon:yes gene_type:complete